MNTTTPAISPLRQRMIEDMRMRKLAPKTQVSCIRAVRHFAGHLGRSPDQASAEDRFCRRRRVLTWRSEGYRAAVTVASYGFVPPTCSRTRRFASRACGVRSTSFAFKRPNRSSTLAMVPVQPVWWLAPRPAPLSPWKYS